MTPHEFIRKWKNHALTERAAAQEHFIDLCHLFGHPTPAEVDPTGKEFTFEKGAAIVGGGDGWADVWKKGYFAWEYKKRKRNLDDAMAQLTRYAASLESPPLLVACDTIRFQIKTTWTNLETKKYEFELEELADPEKFKLLRAVFHEPEALKPVRTRAKLTSDAADKFQAVSDALQSRHPDREAVAHFVNQLVFCFFADSVKLLPEGLLKKLLLTCERRPAKSKDYFDKLFEQMEKGGELDLTEIAWFNGGLFDGSRALPLAHVDIQNLIDATSLDWSLIDPTIFGTLFERFLDPDKRAQIGAHYTDPEKIMLIVEPVVLRPLRREWADVRGEIERAMAPAREAGLAGREGARNQGKKIAAARAKAEKLRDDFIERLTKLRILDPACGSGNFLYLALQGVKDLEYAAINDCETLGLDRPTTRVGPEILHGIEINPFAAELARTTIWIGDIQWAIKNAIFTRPQPFLKKLDSIEQRDAVLTADGKEAAWPEADFIVGNPPFLGGKLLRRGLGDGYVDRLFAAYDGRMPAEADLVCYWFAKAWAMVCSGRAKSAGLVATNSIRGGANRRVLEPIAEAGAIFEAWSDEPWTVEGAAVRVSIVCFAHPHTEENAQRPSRSTRAGGAASQPSPHAEERLKGASRSTRADHATSSFETPASQAPQDEVARRLDGAVVGTINADLTARGADLTRAKRLKENEGVAFMGDTKGGAFDVPGELARSWLKAPLNPNGGPNSDVLRPWANGIDVTRRPRDMWIVDFGWTMSEEEAALYEEPFQYICEHARPAREAIQSRGYAKSWWRHERPRPEMWDAINALSARHGRARPGHPRQAAAHDGVDARHKAGHDGGEARYIVTPTVAKHRLFGWELASVCADHQLIAIARDDDTTFGILHSRFHEAWSLRLGTSLEDRPRYTPTTTFETFPFPEGLTPNIPAADYADDPRAQRIAEAARALDEARRNWLNPPDLVEIVPEVVPGYPDRILPKDAQAAVKLKERTLTNLYNQRPQWLVNAHDKLDRAVTAAYGWPEDISTEDALAKLLELNLKRAAEG
ncbi:DNA methyltransferase [Methylocystis sp. JR02]|uniref:class I SAM-dependent DNA methyltransferase n=1 Tax=Methylocystis sp. JR02 TaxID=3046284 RepID=UPI0024B95C98|nr:DNA methyltransferase [Methylocystis sp. JR02]MDJ0447300.1 N-6 DNA methylase [Methylocystis sp. JR02]